MKTFNKIREDSLLEVLKASDPTGKWIHDFVHSDNPKFAGKSKKERIRMALGAAYGAKRANEETENIDEGIYNKDVERAFPDGKARGVKTGASAPKGTSTMPKDKNKAKGQPVNKMSEEIELEEGSFKYHMDKASAAQDRGDEKKKMYHLNNAKTARYAMKTSDYTKHKDLFDKYKQMTEGTELSEGAFSSGALKPSKAALDAIAKTPSKGTVRGKDAKGVYTAKTVNGKEVSRVYENKLADKETDYDFHPTIKNKKKPDEDESVPVHVVKPQITFSSLRNKNDKEKEEKNMDEAYPSYSGDRAEKLLKRSGDLYTQSKSENDPNKKSSLVAQSNKAHKVAMSAQKQHHKRNPEEVQAYVSRASKPPKGWTNE